MATQTKGPAKKQTNSRSKKTRSSVRVGGQKSTTPWYRRWQVLAFILAFGVIGTVLLVLTRAATPTAVNCTQLARNGSTLKYCTTASPSYNALLANADFVAADNNSTMATANIELDVCSPQTLQCKPVDTSNVIRLYNSSQPRYQRLYTHGITFLRGALYRTCMSMTTNAGWTLTSSCTPIITYNNDVNNAPQAYTGTAQPAFATTSSSSLASSSTCNEGSIARPTGGYYQCSLDEEFNGSSLDTSKWSPVASASTSFNRAPDCYVNSPSNIAVSGGTLNLTTRKEASPFTCYSPQRGSYTAQVTSGTVSTYKKFSQQYGRFEIRAKVPNVAAQGLMQSFWLWPDNPFDQDPGNAPWPATGEIDIAEMYHVTSDRAIPFIHYVPATADTNVTDNYCYIDISQYHTYVLTWTADTIRVDVDGYNCVLDHPNPKSPEASPQPFNKPFFLTLTSGLGVTSNSYVDGVTPLPATTQVDYVRIWK